MQISVKIYLFVQEIFSIISLLSKFSVFCSGVNLKIRSMSQNPNQVFGISKCCIHASFGQDAIIGSRYIVHI